MNKEQQRQPLVLNLSRELWDALSPKQQHDQRALYQVKVAPSFAPAEDLDQLREMAPAARYEVA